MVGDDELLPLLDVELKRLGADKNELILDGSPRSMYQAEWLVKKAKAGELFITGVIHLKASKDVVKTRLMSRGRPDDTEPAIAERFAEYDKTILPILDYLQEQGYKVYNIDGEGPVEQDAKLIENALNL